ncbi:hypothetical protein [Pseudopontixanthobacter vadosimaris]|uniref:hypothetical protein n=1 Tax=Pseudopontixanthobacter vadosimaris TaxID=2726450 RepID=UPI001473C78E|nr:hypothetical protein [Pseudopontixanthobacter vadosimaris]
MIQSRYRKAQMRRIEPYLSLLRKVLRVHHRGIDAGIIFVIRSRLRRQDAPRSGGSDIRWSRP